MPRMYVVALMVICWLAAAGSGCCAVAGVFSEELDTALYDCALTLTPARDAAAGAAVHVSLEGGVRLTITRKLLTLNTVRVDLDLAGGAPAHLLVMRRGGQLGVRLEEQLLYQGAVARGGGSQASVSADAGWQVDDARVQRLEPVVFADNFMRTPQQPSPWSTQRGTWALQSVWDEDPHASLYRQIYIDHAQNPFAWVGAAPAHGSALCTVGQPAWEHYTLTVAVRPGADGAAGAVVNMPDAHSGLLVRWSAANAPGDGGNALGIYRMAGDTLTLLARDAGGYVPGQWYKLTVTATPERLRVAIDGNERLSITAPTPWRGGVGLYAEGKHGSVFDDVTVYGQTLKTSLIAESQAAKVNTSFQFDRLGRMQKWATLQSEWQESPLKANYWLHNKEFYGDQRVALSVKLNAAAAGQLWLALNADGKTATAGFRAVAQLTAKGETQYRLYRGEQQLASAKGQPLRPGVDYTFRLWHAGAELWLEVDGTRVVAAAGVKALDGKRAGYYAEGAFTRTAWTVNQRELDWAWTWPGLTREGLARVPDAIVLSSNFLDYTFTEEPVDWLAAEGTWGQTVRWACSPGWSFMGGYGRGDVVLWHKQRFSGDQTFETYFGVKMEYPREVDYYDQRYRDFGLTICGDGRNPRSGYAAILGAPDTEGHPNKRTVLLRDGVEVASAEIAVPNPGRESEGHRDWFQVQLSKRGAAISLSVLGQPALTWTDPHPLDGGIPAIWSSNNGFVIGRARLYFANPPQPWRRPLVTIDEPWYREWANVGTPLTLDFPDTWSATGKPVTLQVTPRAVPEADQHAVTVDNHRLTFAPTSIGEHWYQVTASDGEHSSPSYHLAAPVFNPGLKRDDTHALVLYRFDEGDGTVVHDRSAVAPAADLTILNNGHWARGGQGVQIGGRVLLKSAGNAAKLMAIKTANACTLELWVSTDSNYPEFSDRGDHFARWVACLLSWEASNSRRNFTVGHQGEFFTFGAQSTQQFDYDKPLYADGFTLGLHHLVITWDGAVTRAFINGHLMRELPMAWNTANWTPDAPLLLGNRTDTMRAYLGTIYLAAIHDRCFSAEEVERQYEAGPGT